MAADRPQDPSAVAGIMDRLREATADLHAKAEGHPFQTSLVRGTVATEDYARWLGQMMLIHSALETCLAELRTRQPALATVIRDDLFQTERLHADLRHHGVKPEVVRPLPASADFIGWIQRTANERPLALLGANYVLEGSKNGNRFIAKALMRRTGEAPSTNAGFQYLDPHGEAQRPMWQEYRQIMNGMPVAKEDADAMEDAARRTFAAVTRLSDDLLATSPGSAAAHSS